MADEPSRGVKRKRQDNVPTDDDTLAILADLERLAAEVEVCMSEHQQYPCQLTSIE